MKDIPAVEKRLIEVVQSVGSKIAFSKEIRAFARGTLVFIDPEEDWDAVIFGNKARVYEVELKDLPRDFNPVTDARV